MYIMFAIFLLILCGSGEILGETTHSVNHIFYDSGNQKIVDQERLTAKDEIIQQLESKIQHQNDDFIQLKQKVMALEQLVVRKQSFLNGLAVQTTGLQKRASLDPVLDMNIASHAIKLSHESGQFFDDSHSTADSTPVLDADLQYGASRDVHITKESRVSSSVQSVAFHAYLTASVTIGTLVTVVFDHMTLDKGNGYNENDGIYIVPESGTYVISWTILCDLHQAFQTQLIVNGGVMATSYTDSDEINDYHQTSQVIVLALSQGDHVFIRVGDVFRGGMAKIKSDNKLSHPTFSGWKI